MNEVNAKLALTVSDRAQAIFHYSKTKLCSCFSSYLIHDTVDLQNIALCCEIMFFNVYFLIQ